MIFFISYSNIFFNIFILKKLTIFLLIIYLISTFELKKVEIKFNFSKNIYININIILIKTLPKYFIVKFLIKIKLNNCFCIN